MSEGAGLQPIARWRIVASLALIAQVMILLAFKSALEEESWFVEAFQQRLRRTTPT